MRRKAKWFSHTIICPSEGNFCKQWLRAPNSLNWVPFLLTDAKSLATADSGESFSYWKTKQKHYEMPKKYIPHCPYRIQSSWKKMSEDLLTRNYDWGRQAKLEKLSKQQETQIIHENLSWQEQSIIIPGSERTTSEINIIWRSLKLDSHKTLFYINVFNDIFLHGACAILIT